MKSKAIYIGLLLAICLSLYFTYQRSFVSRDFEVINSEEEDVSAEATEEMGVEESVVPEDILEGSEE